MLGSVSFLQPTPSVRVRGRRNSVTGKGGRISRSVMATPTVLPARAAAERALMATGFWMAQSFSTAQVSMAGMPRRSVAVVTTGVAPVFSAIRTARALAPPIWPESSGITCCPASSMTTTAGSVVLSRIKGAMARTAMPQAPMKSRASEAAKCSRVHCITGTPRSTGMPRISAQLWPFSVKAMALIFIFPPPGTCGKSWDHRVWTGHRVSARSRPPAPERCGPRQRPARAGWPGCRG